jgi:uncharacterized membrane protein YgcG
VVLVPLDQQKSFGDLYEIRSQPNEIFANGAVIDNIDVIEALTSTNLRTAPGSGVGASIAAASGITSSGGSGGGSSGGGSSGGGGY